MRNREDRRVISNLEVIQTVKLHRPATISAACALLLPASVPWGATARQVRDLALAGDLGEHGYKMLAEAGIALLDDTQGGA